MVVISSCLALLFYEFFYAGLSLVGPLSSSDTKRQTADPPQDRNEPALSPMNGFWGILVFRQPFSLDKPSNMSRVYVSTGVDFRNG